MERIQTFQPLAKGGSMQEKRSSDKMIFKLFIALLEKSLYSSHLLRRRDTIKISRTMEVQAIFPNLYQPQRPQFAHRFLY
jgi:hypothetical protein